MLCVVEVHEIQKNVTGSMIKRTTGARKKEISPKKAVPRKAASTKKTSLTIMVSSTVYGAEGELDQIAAILRQYGYKVVMSRDGSVYVPVGYTPTQACLQAVNDCDLFFGIIYPRYGSGITHKEFQEATKLDKPRWFISHEKIEFLRKLLQPKMYTKKGKRTKFHIPKTSVLDSIEVVEMYNGVRSNWVQSFTDFSEVMSFIDTQFSDMAKRAAEINNHKENKK